MAEKEIMNNFLIIIISFFLLISSIIAQSLKVSPNGRFFTENGKPFFWLGDTAWLLFKKGNREDTVNYLNTRKKQGFNVVQVMVLHDIKNTKNAYGDDAIIDSDISKPIVTAGYNLNNSNEYDYWDHVEWVIDEAAKRKMYMGLVLVWGSNVKGGSINETQARAYAEFLTNRFKNKPNIIWLNGGDLRGNEGENVWKVLGKTLRENDKNHLITFHPRGRFSSTDWFHNENWLDFNMFQSGHKTYAQDNSPNDKHFFGEDNWRYVNNDFKFNPAKPTIDGEPSYENIPQGLHDIKQPRWTDSDLRRYAYWSVFAGGAGFTYGENSVMQFYKKGEQNPAYGAEIDWRESINANGANQMQFLKNLILSKPYFERIPAIDLVANQGEKYNYIAATKGKNYALFYTFTGREIEVKMGFLKGSKITFFWFNPKDGSDSMRNTISNKGVQTFNPPGEEQAGNDWVLVLKR